MKFFLERYLLPFLFNALHCLSSPVHAQEASNATLNANHAVQKLIAEVKGNRGQGTHYSIPMERYSTPTNDLPIGVFDSGIGGLTVLETILSLDEHNNRTGQPGKDGVPDFQNERFIYLGDQANMPYGNYAAVGKEDLLREFILRDAMFLLGNRYWENKQAAAPKLTKLPVKAIVIACNTATAYGLEDIRSALQDWQISIPVIGVVEAGANAVVQELPSNRPSGAVAVMATLGTCSSGAYPKAIAKSAGQAGKRQPVVWQQGSLGLAGAIEGNRSFVRDNDTSAGQAIDYQGPSLTNTKAPIQPGLMSLYAFDANGLSGGSVEEVRLNSVENYVKYDVVSMIESYRQSGATAPIGRVILGCTHFPFESERIAENLQRLRQYRAADGSSPFESLISPEVQLIDPGALTAKQLFRTLTLSKLRSSSSSDSPPQVEGMFLSVSNPRHEAEQSAESGFTTQYKYGRTAGEARGEDFLVVPLTKETLPESLVRLVSTHCKSIWKELTAQDSNAEDFSFQLQEDRLSISLGKQPIADFVFQDPKILRPYFSNLKTSDGQQVTRNHPPREGQDAMDHDTMHPGIWLAFGDISGNDFWRNQASVAHRDFSEKPVVSGNELRFTTESDMLGTDGRVLSVVTNRIRLLARPSGWMIVWAANFQAERDIVFGDQEEMGFGARVATEITEKNGGTMINSKGLTSAAKTWGQPAVWCDYHGKVADHEMGVMLMASSANFRESWWHNRNYGLMVANPFGRKAMKQGDLSAVPVKKGESLELTFGAMVHSGPAVDRDSEYAHFAEAIRKPNVSPSTPLE